MAFEIEYTQRAANHLRRYRKFEQKIILDAADEQLQFEPMIETRNRKQLSENELASWELRIGDFRVFYDINPAKKGGVVKIKAVGHKKHNTLYIGGKEFKL